ncbi:meiotic recombination protein SPO11-1 isoform X2 [Oryza brachyantha]|uniref:meiotic recombination protein SPO11-1 isoform X2 n=1 Tax=Oryza brachyantha TaxID=4533 RepID=UPI001ADCD61D|nr:meiotic recombination protein SPO11-1 isoform X2 [Oryza brachyantha]
MAGREKRRRAAVLDDDDEQRRVRRQEEAAILLRRIRGLVRWVVSEVAAGRSPSVALHRYQNYCASAAASPCACSYDVPVGTDVVSLLHSRDSHTSRLNVLLRVLLVVQQLLQQNKHCSKRDIYYMYPSIFQEQAVVDRGINDICVLFKCSRHNLNVVPVAKGLVMGWIRFLEGEKKVNCIINVNAAFSIPVSIEEIKDVVSVADYILVVEKETVFQRLANDKEEATQIFQQEDSCATLLKSCNCQLIAWWMQTLMVLTFWPPINLVHCNWRMMQISYVYLICGGLGSSHLILRIIAFQSAAYFTCHLKIGGKLKEFSRGVTCTGKPHNGGWS